MKKLPCDEAMSIKTIFFFIAVFFISCASEPVYQRVTIAVWDLEDLSPSNAVRPDFGEILSGQIIKTLQKRGDFVVVERERLMLALEELHIGTTLADESTRLKLGRLVGARLMVFGGYQIIGDKMRLDLRLVEVETGRVLKTSQKTNTASDLSGQLESARKAADELY